MLNKSSMNEEAIYELNFIGYYGPDNSLCYLRHIILALGGISI